MSACKTILASKNISIHLLHLNFLNDPLKLNRNSLDRVKTMQNKFHSWLLSK